MKIPSEVFNWEIACGMIAMSFVTKYFGSDRTDWWWVADRIGGCFCIGDYFWNVEVMVDALRKNVTEEVLFSWYDQSIEPNGVNLQTYLKMKK